MIKDIFSKWRHKPDVEPLKIDPAAKGPQIAAREIYAQLVAAMKDERGVHAESILCALGALAGYACQADLRAQAKQKGLPEKAVLVVIETKNGGRYYFGEALNSVLAASPCSLRTLVTRAATEAGATELPDIKGIFAYVSESVGHDHFGTPRLPASHKPDHKPIHYLKQFWPVLFPVTQDLCHDASEWPVAFALAAQQGLLAVKDILDPAIAFTILMECAIPMSKVEFPVDA